jgi:hypothetical protein
MSGFEHVIIGSIMVVLVLFLLGYGIMLWRDVLPAATRERLSTLLWKVRWTPRHPQRDPPIYRVMLDGHLRYAASQKDVESYLCGLWVQAGMALLERLRPGQSVDIVFLHGDESVVLQIVREP